MNKYIQTFTGRSISYTHLESNDYDIADIAVALSRTCRYSGHCKRFYSVAEHSVYLSLIVPEADALAALMHDATEAYMCDIPAPLKSMLPDYQAIELRMLASIFAQLGSQYPLPNIVKEMDTQLLRWEAKQLLADSGNDICNSIPSSEMFEVKASLLPKRIACLSPPYAEIHFLGRYLQLTRK